MVNASRWEKNEQIVLKGLSEHFSEKIYCKLIIKRCQKMFQSLVLIEATIVRDASVMCNVNKV